MFNKSEITINIATLLNVLYAIGLTDGQFHDLCDSMSLDRAEVEELFIRARKNREKSIGLVKPGCLWEDDFIQFCRLLDELQATGLTDGQMNGVCEEMKLDRSELIELFIIAGNQYDSIKAQL